MVDLFHAPDSQERDKLLIHVAADVARRRLARGVTLNYPEAVELNPGRPRTRLVVRNTGDRPVQVGSHYHFAAANPGLEFDRDAARGHRLDIPAGTSVGSSRASNARCRWSRWPAGASCRGCGEHGRPGAVRGAAGAGGRRPGAVGRHHLLIEVTEDRSMGPAGSGDEVIFGGGKVIRESTGQSLATRADGAPDLVITGVVVLDHWGVVKADVGVRDGRIVGIGKAGNPDTMDGVDPALVIGPSTEVIGGQGKILTAGGVDCHVHFICPQLTDTALASGSPR